MKFPTSNFGKFAFYFVMQFVSYALVVANGRAYVLGSYGWTALTDGLIAFQNFIVIRRFIKDSGDEIHGPSLIGYVSGGVCGSLFAIWITKMVYGQ